MSDIFSGITGIQFPDVVMNSGPLPPQSGHLPAPLHDTPDGKINYNSTLLGDLTPYSYGGPAHLSTQHSYLNIPHRIQKIIPVIHLPEPSGKQTFRLSHGVDDGDLSFTLTLNKSSLFCTGSKSSFKRQGLGTSVDHFINLPTVNYILACIQTKCVVRDAGNPGRESNLWMDFIHALDGSRFPTVQDVNNRNYSDDIIDLNDIVHIVQNCIRPFGIMRGSEKQGGQDEVGSSPSTWPVPFVGTMVVDGKEDHIVNMWHNLDTDAGSDLVLALKPMKLPPRYTLNHHYKQCIYKDTPATAEQNVVWQLVPCRYTTDRERDHYDYLLDWPTYRLPTQFSHYYHRQIYTPGDKHEQYIPAPQMAWQELGYWHIGRTQVRLNKYCVSGGDYYYNDMVNGLRSQYMIMTVQPVFRRLKYFLAEYEHDDELCVYDHVLRMNSQAADNAQVSTKATTFLDSIFDALGDDKKKDTTLSKRQVNFCDEPPTQTFKWTFIKSKPSESSNAETSHMQVDNDATVDGTTVVTHEDMENTAAAESVSGSVKKSQYKRKKTVSSTLLHSDGSVEHHVSEKL